MKQKMDKTRMEIKFQEVPVKTQQVKDVNELHMELEHILMTITRTTEKDINLVQLVLWRCEKNKYKQDTC